MLQLIISSSLIIFNFIFMTMNHPLAMGLMLMIQTILICIMIGIMSKTFWFSYILFLIFLGGMLVLFIYTTSLASNEMFSFSMKTLILSIITLIIMLMMSMILDKMMITNMFSNMESTYISNMNNYIKENSLSMNKLYNYPTNLTTILLMNYLLITLVATVKITNLFFGPLRMMN